MLLKTTILLLFLDGNGPGDIVLVIIIIIIICILIVILIKDRSAKEIRQSLTGRGWRQELNKLHLHDYRMCDILLLLFVASSHECRRRRCFCSVLLLLRNAHMWQPSDDTKKKKTKININANIKSFVFLATSAVLSKF